MSRSSKVRTFSCRVLDFRYIFLIFISRQNKLVFAQRDPKKITRFVPLQVVCALRLRCIVDSKFSRWRRRSRNFAGYMLYFSIDTQGDTSSLYTNTLYFIYLSLCYDKYRCWAKRKADLMPTEKQVLEKMPPSTSFDSLITASKWTSCNTEWQNKISSLCLNTVAGYSEEAPSILWVYHSYAYQYLLALVALISRWIQNFRRTAGLTSSAFHD